VILEGYFGKFPMTEEEREYLYQEAANYALAKLRGDQKSDEKAASTLLVPDAIPVHR